MKIAIFGLGYVGSAVAWAHRNHEIISVDPKLGDKSATVDQAMTADAIYICVPTPMESDGHCNESIVRSVLNSLEKYDRVIISKSTLPPGSYQSLYQKFPNLVHSPEFLTAANAQNDYESANWVLIGGDPLWASEAGMIMRSSTILATEYCYTDIVSASLFKYIANSFLATKVTFMNDMFHLAKTLGVDWSEIQQISTNDPRLGHTHWAVPGPDGMFGYGGACFPKDVSAIIEHARDLGGKLMILETIREVNNYHRNFKG